MIEKLWVKIDKAHNIPRLERGENVPARVCKVDGFDAEMMIRHGYVLMRRVEPLDESACPLCHNYIVSSMDHNISCPDHPVPRL